MNILDTTSWSDTSEFPVKKGTIDFLQSAYREIFAAMLKASIGPSWNPSVMYVLFGVQNAGVVPFYNMSAGAIFYQEEVFMVDAAAFTATGSNVALVNHVTMQYTSFADPVTFTDLAVRNVHNMRKLQIVQGASGTGERDLTQLNYQNLVAYPQLNLTATGQAVKSGAYPNINIDVPVSGNLNPILGAGSVHIGDVPGGGVAIPVAFGTAGQCAVLPGGQQYYVMGQLISQGGSPHDDSTVTVAIIDSSRTSTGFSIRCQEWTAGIQSLAFEYIIFAK